MNLQPRIRTAIKWGGAVVTVLLVVAWIGSAWWNVAIVAQDGRYFRLIAASMQVGRFDFPGAPQAVWYRAQNPVVEWRYWSEQGAASGWTVSIPLWSFASIALAISLFAWIVDAYARRHARRNLCPKCGYDRAGIAGDAKCPECGCGGRLV